jgi:hypothetical protein
MKLNIHAIQLSFLSLEHQHLMVVKWHIWVIQGVPVLFTLNCINCISYVNEAVQTLLTFFLLSSKSERRLSRADWNGLDAIKLLI